MLNNCDHSLSGAKWTKYNEKIEEQESQIADRLLETKLAF